MTSTVPSTTANGTVTKDRAVKTSHFYDVDDLSNKIDVGSQPGTQWTLSSFKPGSGVPELRSSDMTKLWQSDGSQPHLINIQFAKLTAVTHISIYLDVKQDDSYTPTKIAVKAGTNYHDLVLVRQRSFTDTGAATTSAAPGSSGPQGWKHFRLDGNQIVSPAPTESTASTFKEEEDEVDDETNEGSYSQNQPKQERTGIQVWLLQICVLANHLNGKDTHIRRVMVFGPRPPNQGHARHAFGSTLTGKRTSFLEPSVQPNGEPKPKTSKTSHGQGDDDETMLYQTIPQGDQDRDLGQDDLDAFSTPNITLADLLDRGPVNGQPHSDNSEPSPFTSNLNLFGNIR